MSSRIKRIALACFFAVVALGFSFWVMTSLGIMLSLLRGGQNAAVAPELNTALRQVALPVSAALAVITFIVFLRRQPRNTSFMPGDYPIRRTPSYAPIDGAIHHWCNAHLLHLFTDYKDYDVRSVDVVGSNGRRCQVWVDPPEKGLVTIHIWPYAPPHERITVPIEDVALALEKAYEQALQLVSALK